MPDYRIPDNHGHGKDGCSDNNCGCHKLTSSKGRLYDLITDKRLDSIQANNDSLLVYPYSFSEAEDLDEGARIIETHGDGHITTGNIMGFIGCKNEDASEDETLTIHSRFANGNEDYFLYYMLAKINRINVVDLQVANSPREQYLDFLMLLFPAYVQEAMRKGVFRRYMRRSYNDSNIKGPIDVARHIKLNTPFVGRVAYNVREYSANNPLMQLIRHTAEYIGHSKFRSILNGNKDFRDNIKRIEAATESYRLQDREGVIRKNLKPVRHAYYYEYRALQKLCLAILRHDRTSFGQGSDKLYGILFDGAWLWEEYVNVLLQEEFGSGVLHPRNKAVEGERHPQQLFYGLDNNDKQGLIYPDFLINTSMEINKIPDSCDIVADAKYKPTDNIHGRDYLQLLAYMYRFGSLRGFYLYPNGDIKDSGKQELNLLGQSDVHITKLGLDIPSDATDMRTFTDEMNGEHGKESKFIKQIKKN
jgi:5-methylcytosine-specific restriction endonuclease McrBC regulatory subunit McrC